VARHAADRAERVLWFYSLDPLSREARDQEDVAPAPAVHADAPAEPGAP